MPEPHAAENLPEKPAPPGADHDVEMGEDYIPADDGAAAAFADRAMIRTIGQLLCNLGGMEEPEHVGVQAAKNEMLQKACERASRIFEADERARRAFEADKYGDDS